MDNAWYACGWDGPYLGDYNEPGYRHMNEPMMMEDIVDDPMADPLGLGPDYYGAMAEPEGYFNNPTLINEARRRRETADAPREYGLGGMMGPETHAFMEERGLPMPYGGDIDGLPYGNGRMPYAHEGDGWNSLRGLTYPDGMPMRSLEEDFRREQGGRRLGTRLYDSINGRGEDAALSMGTIGRRSDYALEAAEQRMPGTRNSLLEPYGPHDAEYLPRPFTRDQFMQEELPLTTAWARDLPRQVPLRYDDRHFFERPGPHYRQPDILDEYDRGVLSAENLAALQGAAQQWW